jgi:cyclopropane-fatty-acyl-phospholipid synthase
MSSRARQKIERLLALADVKPQGERPWDVCVHDDRFFGRVLADGSLGLGESYLEGWWDCLRLDELFYRILRAELHRHIVPWSIWLDVLKARLFNLQRLEWAFHIGRHHYDLGNDLFQCMLGPTMTYSGAYWQKAATLDEAQQAKLDLVCRKLDLRPGMRVLDIGCGWGSAARFAAEHFGVEVVGITVSAEQARFAHDFCHGLPVEIRLQDYRTLDGRFDRILSLGMFEHVGPKNYRTYLATVRRLLASDGLFVLQTIGANETGHAADPWLARYIFPNSKLPSARQIATAAEDLWVIEDWHSFGPDYDRTLMAWYANFRQHWDELKGRYGPRFYRMWTYYLLSCAGTFRARAIQLWQLVLSPHGVAGGYRPLR